MTMTERRRAAIEQFKKRAHTGEIRVICMDNVSIEEEKSDNYWFLRQVLEKKGYLSEEEGYAEPCYALEDNFQFEERFL